MKKIKRGEIYFADLSLNLGSEQNGVRPVLILQNNKGNEYSPTTIIAPMTSIIKRSLPTHIKLDSNTNVLSSTVLLEQIRTIDKQRLLNKIGSITDLEMKRVEKAINVSLGMREKNELWKYKKHY